MLERAGIQRADLVVAVTGDDEDNLLICQVAKEKYLCERIIARVNNPRNLDHFKLLGIQPAVSRHRPDPAPDRARGAALRPRPPARSARGAAGDHRARGLRRRPGRRVRRSRDMGLPDGALVISVLRGGLGFRAQGRHRRRGRRRGARGPRSGYRGRHHRQVRGRERTRLAELRLRLRSRTIRDQDDLAAAGALTPRSACEQGHPSALGPVGNGGASGRPSVPSPGRAATAARPRRQVG